MGHYYEKSLLPWLQVNKHISNSQTDAGDEACKQ